MTMPSAPVVDVLVGMQWGSEGKGKVAGLLAHNYDAHVRVGGPNAGHTIYHKGVKYVMRSVPCGWINNKAELFIGPGATVNINELKNEVKLLEELSHVDIANRIMIDRNAVCIHQSHINAEKESLAWMGSTCHGIGEAIKGKISRARDSITTVRHMDAIDPIEFPIIDVSEYLQHHYIKANRPVLLEGTQGTMLSIDHGDWPFVTARNVTASGIAAEVGIAPADIRQVIGVARTYPIRVGGNSGPMGDEITWDEVRHRSGSSEPIIERTTVTNKIRRVAEPNWRLMAKATNLNKPDVLIMTFADYIDYRVHNRKYNNYTGMYDFMQIEQQIEKFAAMMAAACGVPVSGVSWGPNPDQTILAFQDFANPGRVRDSFSEEIQ